MQREITLQDLILVVFKKFKTIGVFVLIGLILGCVVGFTVVYNKTVEFKADAISINTYTIIDIPEDFMYYEKMANEFSVQIESYDDYIDIISNQSLSSTQLEKLNTAIIEFEAFKKMYYQPIELFIYSNSFVTEDELEIAKMIYASIINQLQIDISETERALEIMIDLKNPFITESQMVNVINGFDYKESKQDIAYYVENLEKTLKLPNLISSLERYEKILESINNNDNLDYKIDYANKLFEDYRENLQYHTAIFDELFSMIAEENYYIITAGYDDIYEKVVFTLSSTHKQQDKMYDFLAYVATFVLTAGCLGYGYSLYKIGKNIEKNQTS